MEDPIAHTEDAMSYTDDAIVPTEHTTRLIEHGAADIAPVQHAQSLKKPT